MSLSNTSLPKPKNWQDFESMTRELMACVLNDPNTQQHGRSGQAQSGVDIYGFRSADHLVGVQCKKKSEEKVSDKELRAEVKKAKTFNPKLSEFILITTAPRDQKIQKSARLITEELAKTDHPMRVSVWGWEDVEAHAAHYDRAWKAFDPTWTPFAEQASEKIILEIQQLKQSIEMNQKVTRPSSSALADASLNESDEKTLRHGQITAYQKLIDDGDVTVALTQLTRLQNDEWSNSSKSERYRILVGIASAKLKLGERNQAGDILLDAYKECPEHKNARKNQATGYLLKNDYIEAAKLAREMLAADSNNADAARMLIQALVEDDNCTDPLVDVPETLHQTKEVLVAHIQFLRGRGNPNWINLAKNAAEKHPDSRLLKLFAAEAVLDEIVRTDRDALAGGILQKINISQFKLTVETLYSEARDAIDKKYALLPHIAHTAAVALRLSNDFTRAKEILDAAIMQYPTEENLKLQRSLIAFSEEGPAGALAVLTNKPKDPEAIGVLAEALLATGKPSDALTLVDEINEGNLSEHVKTAFLDIRSRVYIARGERQPAIDLIAERISAEPHNIGLRALQIRTYLAIGDADGANKAFKEAVAHVNEQTNLPSRLMLSFEARQLGRDDVIVDLLKGRVATDRESEALHALIAASINAGSWVTAHKVLGDITQSLRGQDWFLRADAILAINIGDPTADEKIAQYLRISPNDTQMILARIGTWQRRGRDGDIKIYLQSLNLANIVGRPEERIRIAALISHYGEALRGLEYGYSVLMDNWDVPKAHLAYQGLVFLNENIGEAMPLANVVAENTVVCLSSDEGERRYRIEKVQHGSFGDERLKPESDLASLLIGKQVGDKITLQNRIGSKPVEVLWIKHIYIDAFHSSLQQFNERFPRAHGLQTYKYDPDAPDPFVNMRAMIKAVSEADQHILAEYQNKSIPLSFVAALIGKDPIETWSALPSVNIQFQVCRGTHPEREDARQAILKNSRKGCVLDAITLSVIRRLGVEKVVADVCGPIHTTQSVVHLFASRALEAKQNIGRKQGFVSWRDDRMVYQEYSEDTVKTASDECEREISWVRGAVNIVPAMPKKDFSPEALRTINMVGHIACDAAVAAEGKELLLLSEDMGFRIWSAGTFEISTTWLQPVLIAAREQGVLETEEYCKAINMLALSDHSYISLNVDCLMHQSRKDNYELTNNLSRLIRIVGGPSADLHTNSGVLSAFIDELLKECSDDSKAKRIASEAFFSITRGRQEDQRHLIAVILKKMRTDKRFMIEHALSWLIGHSIGMPYFDELIQQQKEISQ